MAEKFTPGPWQVDGTKGIGAYGVWTDYGTHPGDIPGELYPDMICSMRPQDTMGTRDRRDANAALIACSPDFYVTAKALCDRHDERARAANFEGCGCEDCTPFREILKKARGE